MRFALALLVACNGDRTQDSGTAPLPPETGLTDTSSDTAPPTAYVPPTGPTYTLHFEGPGYTAQAGKPMAFRLVWLHAQDIAAWEGTITVPTNGSVVESFPGVLVEGGEYILYWYVDLNGNGSCDPPPTDHVWSTEDAGTYGGFSVPIGPITEDFTLVVPANSAFDFDGCDEFAGG